MSMFDPAAFLDQQVLEASSTVVVPIPEGEYNALIEKTEARQWQSRNDPTKAGIAVDITWKLDDINLPEEFRGRTVKQGLMLDLTDSGGLDMGRGKNVALGRLREAVGLNQPGQPFAFSMLPGRMARVLIKHRIYEDQIFAEVKGTAKLA